MLGAWRTEGGACRGAPGSSDQDRQLQVGVYLGWNVRELGLQILDLGCQRKFQLWGTRAWPRHQGRRS